MNPRKIAIVAEWLTSRGGAEKVIESLLEIFPDADLYTSVFNKKTFPELAGRNPRTSYLQKIPVFSSRHQLIAPLLPMAMRRMKLEGYDLVISSSSSVGKFVKKSKTATHICYCHTPMRYAWEPETDPRIIKLPLGKFFVRILKKWDLESNKSVDYFIANSANTKERIKKYYNRESVVINPPVDVDKLPEEKKSDFYFCISRLVTYKRIDLAVRAAVKLKRKLIVAGDGPELLNLKNLAENNSDITILGRISDKEKETLYKKARAVIFPADEDFGIVPVEANSYGTPVIGYNHGGTTETIKDGVNGVLFEKQSVDSLCQAIEKFEKMEFDCKIINESAKKFSKENFEKNIKNFIKSI